MARSTYIYFAVWAQRVGDTQPVAARTVKYEMVGLIADLPADDREAVHVWRVPDGIERGKAVRAHLGTGAEFLAREQSAIRARWEKKPS